MSMTTRLFSVRYSENAQYLDPIWCSKYDAGEKRRRSYLW